MSKKAEKIADKVAENAATETAKSTTETVETSTTKVAETTEAAKEVAENIVPTVESKKPTLTEAVEETVKLIAVAKVAFYVTKDKQKFVLLNDAQNHAETLQDKEIITEYQK